MIHLVISFCLRYPRTFHHIGNGIGSIRNILFPPVVRLHLKDCDPDPNCSTDAQAVSTPSMFLFLTGLRAALIAKVFRILIREVVATFGTLGMSSRIRVYSKFIQKKGGPFHEIICRY